MQKEGSVRKNARRRPVEGRCSVGCRQSASLRSDLGSALDIGGLLLGGELAYGECTDKMLFSSHLPRAPYLARLLNRGGGPLPDRNVTVPASGGGFRGASRVWYGATQDSSLRLPGRSRQGKEAVCVPAMNGL